MSDRLKDPAAETPIRRALRMKTAALEARSRPPAAPDPRRAKVAGVAAGASKPWMKK